MGRDGKDNWGRMFTKGLSLARYARKRMKQPPKRETHRGPLHADFTELETCWAVDGLKRNA